MTAVRRFLAAQWPAAASALLHGGVLALVLWQMSPAPVTVPLSGEVPLTVDLVTVEAPAKVQASSSPVGEPASEPDVSVTDPQPEPVREIAEAPAAPAVEREPSPPLEAPVPPIVVEEPPPAIESSVAEIVAPPPPPPPPPEIKPAPDPKPAATRRTVPSPKPAAPSPPQTAALAPSTEDKPTLMLPRPGSMLAPESSAVAPIVPPVPVGPPVDYVGLVRAQLERFKQYPRVAQQRRLQGEVMLSIIIDGGGRVLHYRLVKGSGHEILDREVSDLVKRASPLPPIPARLQTDRLEIVVPIAFSLQG